MKTYHIYYKGECSLEIYADSISLADNVATLFLEDEIVGIVNILEYSIKVKF